MSIREWCLQYQEWKDICEDVCIGGGIGKSWGFYEWKDITGKAACIHELPSLYVRIIEEACATNDILLAVTEDIPPEILGLSEEDVNNTYEIISYKLQLL